jgi:putative FmdB family regulatory protein
MPTYEYKCPDCEDIIEVNHSMNEKKDIDCKQCNTRTTKIISRCSFAIKHTFAKRQMHDDIKSEDDAREDLKQNYGVEKVNITDKNNSFQEVYGSIKGAGSYVRDKMQQETEVNKKKTADKKKNWQAQITRKRIDEKTERLKEETNKKEAKKRAIRI